jgi:enoyl-CoA hydratase/carnithine racemase
VNEVTAEGEWLERAMELAERVARRPPIAVRLAKQAVLAADETALTAVLEHERRLYALAKATGTGSTGSTPSSRSAGRSSGGASGDSRKYGPF